MTHQEYKETYHRMPAEFRKHGDMPTVVDMWDDVDNYILLTKIASHGSI